CFFCKTELWSRLVPAARARGLAIVCDGTNADDLLEHRPGRAAGVTAGIRSPLAEVGMTKAQVREASRSLGLPTWDAPAAPCLSSRVLYGLRITPERLRQVEAGEAFLRALGVRGDLRLRHLGDTARIEVEREWIAFVTDRLDEVRARLTALGFSAVEVDPRGYRRPGVVWLGIARDPALELLQHGTEREFGPLGCPPEVRAFRPHLTVGRAGRDARARDFEGFEGALATMRFEETVVVETLDLM